MYWQHGHGVPIGAQNSEVVPYFIRYIQDRRSYDLTTFYNVENALDVVEYSISQGSKNKNFFAGQGIYNYNFSAQMESATPGQVKSICDSLAAEMEQKAEQLNKEIKELK